MRKKKLVWAITTLIVGLATLVTGIVFLVMNLNKGAAAQDGDYLVAQENWTLSNSDKVVWDFTEIGKGTLTTNGHENDYEFKWALEDGKLKIETDWLYELENEYDYTLDQSNGKLTLSADGKEYEFVANS